ncbi:SAM-dependent methyltransferase [Amycolatopsis sp., V23-08]|uniref:SAM-dependent methyltransferase n=1 Tax=Amycolatopsis heterodermiae TaxID=3110235 RepID=A0ABU5RM19_9PSEU|nr:SAM-dependent methyltransferase [Amycolatopsis sp., V23-08]MEA5367332.1 SAM-dependent methyltransferase [Amycolatopsis sp., V23-08]
MPSNDADSPNAPVGVDPSRASVARVYNYLLGGKDNYEIDRRTADQLSAAMPDVVEVAVENRLFLIRAIRFLAHQTGITQFLDCGSGLPTAENVHQVAQRFDRLSKVVYVDNDPVVTAHGRALLEDNELTRYVEGDIFDPRSILDHETVRDHLDWTQPIVLSQVATLHHHKGDRHAPAEVMREYIDALPPGSHVLISHLLDPQEPADSDAAHQLSDAVARGSLGGATWRTHDEITELFDGLDLIDPGIVPLYQWWPDGPRLKPVTVAHRIIAGGVGRKP